MKLIIFDIDGTLTDTKQVEDKCFMTAFERTFGLDIRDQDWADLKNVTDWGITEEIIERELNRMPTQEEYQLMISEFIQQLEYEKSRDVSQFKEVGGAKNFFELLRGKPEYRLGIATGSWEQSARLKLDTIGVEIGQLAFSNSDYHKSREEITKHTIRQLKAETEGDIAEIIYFGDGVWDYRTCRNLGIRFIGIDILGDGKLEGMGAKTVFRNYHNPTQILEKIGKSI